MTDTMAEKFKGSVAQAEQVLKDQYTRAEASVRQGLDHTEVKIKEHPFAAVGIAAGVGLIIGLLINRGR